ncbi:hypothetical protein ClosIBUN22A_CONTIG42g00869 [Clostridium sp. IBUN22A]|nr:hypothetical protein ClosIBUN22A_CONTIG42g00869 [Clostridium sp. IBUN22A]
MYFVIFENVFLPSKIPLSKTFRSFFNSITSAISLAASTALSTEMPTSASLKAGTSLTPSPINPTMCPLSRNVKIISTF